MSEATPAGIRPLLVTGCYRSGTTVLEKLLHAHQQLTVASQPYPVLYFFTKGIFLEERGLERRYPLDHLFLEEGYSSDDFHHFLDRRVLTSKEIAQFFAEMERYAEGLWTPEMLRLRDRVEPGTFLEVSDQLRAGIAETFPKSGVRYVGSKEVLVEEFVPYLIDRGVRVVLSLRDPRSMIASLNFRARENLTGANRPLLFSLRAWRKSVAIALAFESHSGFQWLRYEDLVRGPALVLQRITSCLEISPHPSRVFHDEIRDQWGRPWQGNSSFGDTRGVSIEFLETYRELLLPEVIAYVETVCEPEMRALGYQFHAIDRFDEAVLWRYRDPFDSIHGKFPVDYSSDPVRVARECERRALLSATAQPLSEAQACRWFIHPRAYTKLHAAVA
jgi:hypothetical protein